MLTDKVHRIKKLSRLLQKNPMTFPSQSMSIKILPYCHVIIDTHNKSITTYALTTDDPMLAREISTVKASTSQQKENQIHYIRSTRNWIYNMYYSSQVDDKNLYVPKFKYLDSTIIDDDQLVDKVNVKINADDEEVN